MKSKCCLWSKFASPELHPHDLLQEGFYVKWCNQRTKIFQKVLNLLMVHLLKSLCKFPLGSNKVWPIITTQDSYTFLFAINHCKSWINESLFILQVHSVRSALLTKQTRSVPCLLNSFLYQKGPKYVNSTICKWWSIKSPVGRFTNDCSQSCSLSRQHLTHLPTKLLTNVLLLTTQKSVTFLLGLPFPGLLFPFCCQ